MNFEWLNMPLENARRTNEKLAKISEGGCVMWLRDIQISK